MQSIILAATENPPYSVTLRTSDCTMGGVQLLYNIIVSFMKIAHFIHYKSASC